MNPSYRVQANDQLSQLIRLKNITTWNELTDYVKHLPYGRTKNRTDLSLVLKEQKGTCSSKHAFLKHVADLNAIPNVKLILGIYKMNADNTPKIGNILIKNNLDFIPEAHCYLTVNDEYLDYTSGRSDFKNIKNDIIIEQEIEPSQVIEYKESYQKAYFKTWIETDKIPFSFDEIWKIREACIANMSA